MKKPDEEIPGVDAGLSDTGATPSGTTADFEERVGGMANEVLTEMSKRLGYSGNIFRLGSIRKADKSNMKTVRVWHDDVMVTPEVPEEENDSQLKFAFTKALEAKLRELEYYRQRFEQVEQKRA